MKMPSDFTLFSVGERTWSLEDFAVAAKVWGDWERLEKDVRLGIGCLKWAEEEGDDVRDSEMESAANEFRYERDLITSEETEAWLEQWQLSVEDWAGYIRRSLLRGRLALNMDEIETSCEVQEDELDACAYGEAVFSGCLSRVTRKLAGRVSAWQRAIEEQWITATPAQCAEETLQQIEAAYERYRSKTVTPEGITNQVRLRQLDWTRLDCVYMFLSNYDVAREALFCMREDGMTPDEVAKNAKTEVQTDVFYLDQIDAELWNPLLAAKKGDVVGPLRWKDQWALLLLRDKILPSIDSAQVRQRAEETLLSIFIEREIAKRVTWHKRF